MSTQKLRRHLMCKLFYRVFSFRIWQKHRNVLQFSLSLLSSQWWSSRVHFHVNSKWQLDTNKLTECASSFTCRPCFKRQHQSHDTNRHRHTHVAHSSLTTLAIRTHHSHHNAGVSALVVVQLLTVSYYQLRYATANARLCGKAQLNARSCCCA